MLDCRMAAVCGAVAGAALAARSGYERKSLSVEEMEVASDRLTRDWTFVFLSDLHENEFGCQNDRLITAIDRVRPDGILSGGDLIVTKKGQARMCTAEALLSELALRYPVYCANGNHESRMKWKKETYGDSYRRYRKHLEKLGICLLEDESVLIGDEIRVSGLELEPCFYKKAYSGKLASMDRTYIERKLGEGYGRHFQILLAHSPLFFDAYREWGADLTLSGHFHGGTIRLPWLGGVMTPQFQFFLPLCAGIHEKDGKYMAVSRGLGTHSINIRLNNRPQLLIVRLKRKIL